MRIVQLVGRTTPTATRESNTPSYHCQTQPLNKQPRKSQGPSWTIISLEGVEATSSRPGRPPVGSVLTTLPNSETSLEPKRVKKEKSSERNKRLLKNRPGGPNETKLSSRHQPKRARTTASVLAQRTTRYVFSVCGRRRHL